MLDIIHPRKRDVKGNRIGFVKVASDKEAKIIMEQVSNKKFLGAKIDVKLVLNRVKSGINPKENGSSKIKVKPGEAKAGSLKLKSSVKAYSPTEPKEGVENSITLSSNYNNYFVNSYICFSLFPMNGQILHEIFEEMNIVGIRIKEITCWKFLLTFPTVEEKKSFDTHSVSDWVNNFREPHYEDVFIKRKVVLEVRGLPLHACSEENLKLIVSKSGEWGWWINATDTMRRLETPRICCYTNSLDKIERSEQVKFGNVCYQIKMVEVDWDFSKIYSVLHEETTHKLPTISPLKCRESKEKCFESHSKMEREKVARKVVLDDAEDISLSFISRVSETSQSDRELGSRSPGINNKPSSISWEFPNSVDRLDREIILTGDCDGLESSQKTICDLIHKIKIKRVGRPKKKTSNWNPFNVGNCRLLNKHRKNKSAATKLNRNSQRINTMQKDKDKAEKILETAEFLGLQPYKDRKEVLKIIKDQLEQGTI